MTDEQCESCHQTKPNMVAALVNGTYYRQVCQRCLHGSDDELSSNAAGFDRRRQYEDNAQDTIQPYDANGKPRSEFFRLYPQAASKVFTPSEIEQVKHSI